ncbi:MAG: hypothetical protein QXY61_02865 [Candidatus Anstonellales archaeon]
MKKIFILLLLVLLLFAQLPTYTQALENLPQTTFVSAVLSNWQLVSLLLILISLMVAIFAIVGGKSFGLSQLEAWGKIELGEIFINALIVIFIIAFIGFLDALASQVIPCAQGNCVAGSASEYLGWYIKEVRRIAEEIYFDAITWGKISSSSLGFGGDTSSTIDEPGWWFYLYGSLSISSGFSIYLIRDQVLMDFLSSAYSLLLAEKFFLDNMAFVLGPFFILTGVILRSFFLTRRWGGTLIAVGFGAMVVFPGMFLLTFAITENRFSTDIGYDFGEQCPLECKMFSPVAYNSTHSISYLQLIQIARENEWTNEELEGIYNGSKECFGGVCSCDYPPTCPSFCRVLPYPFENPFCADVKENCSEIFKTREKCFLTRVVLEPDYEKLKNVDSRCRVVAPFSIPSSSEYCPSFCMAVYTNGTSYCYDHINYSTFKSGCESYYPQNPGRIWKNANTSFYAENREGMINAAKQTSVYIIHEDMGKADCKAILDFDDPGFSYNPPVFAKCEEHCATKIPTQTHSSRGALTGIRFVENVAKIMISAYLLPLFNIAATIVFISGLASFLGGELFVPGLGELL